MKKPIKKKARRKQRAQAPAPEPVPVPAVPVPVPVPAEPTTLYHEQLPLQLDADHTDKFIFHRRSVRVLQTRVTRDTYRVAVYEDCPPNIVLEEGGPSACPITCSRQLLL